MEELVEEVRDALAGMTEEVRELFVDAILRGYCRDCYDYIGTKPCYCRHDE